MRPLAIVGLALIGITDAEIELRKALKERRRLPLLSINEPIW